MAASKYLADQTGSEETSHSQHIEAHHVGDPVIGVFEDHFSG